MKNSCSNIRRFSPAIFFMLCGGFVLAIFYVWTFLVCLQDLLILYQNRRNINDLTSIHKALILFNPIDVILFFVRTKLYFREQRFGKILFVTIIMLLFTRLYLTLNSSADSKIVQLLQTINYSGYIMISQFYEIFFILSQYYFDARDSGNFNTDKPLEFIPEDEIIPTVQIAFENEV